MTINDQVSVFITIRQGQAYGKYMTIHSLSLSLGCQVKDPTGCFILIRTTCSTTARFSDDAVASNKKQRMLHTEINSHQQEEEEADSEVKVTIGLRQV